MSKNLLSGIANQEKKNNLKNRILLIYEGDVFFSSDFYGQTYNPITLFTNEDLKFIMKEIWNNRLIDNN
jgi:hypothetical protein